MFERIFYFKYRFTLNFEIMVPKRLLNRIYRRIQSDILRNVNISFREYRAERDIR